jgi:hypothetical protein
MCECHAEIVFNGVLVNLVKETLQQARVIAWSSTCNPKFRLGTHRAELRMVAEDLREHEEWDPRACPSADRLARITIVYRGS